MPSRDGPGRDRPAYDAVVLAGGRARRLGGADKPALDIGGLTLLDRVLAAVPDASGVVCVGPSRPTAREVIWCREQPPGSGPAAALAAALPHTSAAVVCVLAADLPYVGPAVPVLIAALAGDAAAGAALLVDGDGRLAHLAAAWRRRALESAIAALGDPADAPVRALTAATRTVLVTDVEGWGRDCDTWTDVESARGELGDRR